MTEREFTERVARALVTADEQNGGPPWDYIVGLGTHAIAARMDQARAAIEAMRGVEEAARAMLKALKNLRRTLASQGGIASGFWRDADAAIKLAEAAGIKGEG